MSFEIPECDCLNCQDVRMFAKIGELQRDTNLFDRLKRLDAHLKGESLLSIDAFGEHRVDHRVQ